MRIDMTMKNSVAYTTRPFLLRLAMAAAIVLASALICRAGGPRNVAGVSYFDTSVAGQPLTWPNGVITYYTDRGDLSGLLPNSAANNFVAGAFSVWTSVPTAALAANSGGSLAEDVNGTNVIVNADGSISMPADIQPTAIGTPLGIVYDYDGSVTDALLGQGAGGASQCFFNAVFGGTDNYSSFATYQHALIVMNGQCAQQSSQLTDVEYRLVRVIGNVLGIGWSQLNVNVQTFKPRPTSDDYAGFPVMHYMDLWNCVPITLCYPNGYQLAMDDVATVSRLYPVTAQNISNYSGKQIFSAASARIHGSVYFTDAHGNRTTPMQGANVVARWIDPGTQQPSHRYSLSSVSGFLFSGNEGNPITGFADFFGNPFSDWGSSDSAVEGFFDLAGLQPPNTGAQYQLSIEPLDPIWSAGVGPYAPGPVAPSGSFTPITVTVTPGGDLEQDIVMSGSAQPSSEPTSSWDSPAALPQSGDWNSSFNTPGDVHYFLLPMQANRTMSVAVTALDDMGVASLAKVQPVIGIWPASDPPGMPPSAYTSSPFNQSPFGMTRLDAVVNASENFLVGISDVRGDGRPDYHYHAHVLYADSVSPVRIPVGGAPIVVQGTGFGPGLASVIGASNGTQLAVSATQLTLAAAAHSDGVQNITISDPVSGAATSMTGVVTYGAAATDTIQVSGLQPPVIVGVPATNPIVAKVLASDGVTPVAGASVGWSATNTVQLSACGGAAVCSVTTDMGGNASTWATPTAPGVVTVTATLAPGVYSPAKSGSVLLNAIEHSSDIGIVTPNVWISQYASVTLPIRARVLSNGSPQSNVQVGFSVIMGSGWTLSASSTATDVNGYASVSLSLDQIASQVEVMASAGSATPAFFNALVIPGPQQVLHAIAGSAQISTGQPFQPVVVRVTDSALTADPVMGAPVNFLTTVLRPQGSGNGDGNSGMPVILDVTQSNTVTDINGIASIVPPTSGFSAPFEVDVAVTAGSGMMLDFPLQVLPALATENLGTTAPCINYGDSITAGSFASPNNGSGNVYSTNGYAGLWALHEGWTCTNTGVNGAQMMDANMAQAIFTTSVPQNALTTLMIGSNDMRSTNCTRCSGGMSDPAAQREFESGFAAEIAWRSIPDGPNKVTAQSCPSSSSNQVYCTYSGAGWVNSPAWGGGVAKQDSTPTDTVTINFSGKTFYFFTVNQFGNTSTYTLTIDGVAVPASSSSFSTQGTISRTFNDATINYAPGLVRLSGLSNTAHILVFTTATVGGLGVTYFAGFAVPDGTIQRTGPYVWVNNTPRAQSAGYGSFGGSDAIVKIFDQMENVVVNQLASDGLNVQLVDVASVMNPQNSSLWYIDGFHPNSQGHIAIDQADEDASTAVLRPSDRGLENIFKSLSPCTVNQPLGLGGCPPKMARGV